jgi:hypothetical protein
MQAFRDPHNSSRPRESHAKQIGCTFVLPDDPAWHGTALCLHLCAIDLLGDCIPEIQPGPWDSKFALGRFDNFTFLFRIQDAREVFGNTLFIATWKIVS